MRHHSIIFQRSQIIRMKAIALFVVALGTVSALGSGPYLPSGWRPKGPAFFLPTEVERTPLPLNEAPLQAEEASGSDFLREYGPPEVSQDITLQALPEVATLRSFANIDAIFADDNDSVTEEVSFSTEEITTEQEAVTESQVKANNVEVEPIVQGKSITEVQNEEAGSLQVNEKVESVERQQTVSQETSETQETSEVAQENTQENNEANQENIQATQEITQTTEEVNEVTEENSEAVLRSDIVATVEEKATQEIEEDVKAVEEGVKSIADALVNLEKEVNAQQVQGEAVRNVQIQESFGTVQAPQGFLEYGPPGFREYGPPKDSILRSDNVVQEQSVDPTETNETRRRRFSPKFKKSPNVLRRKVH